MQATLNSDGRRTGATWVAATGAFLLVAAAAVFMAVRWDDIPDALKLSLIGALTGGCVLGGRTLRRTLPATGDVLFHLGVFLLPVDLAGVQLRVRMGWRQFLLAEALLGVGVVGGLGIATGSVVLRWAGAASMLAVAVAVGAMSPVPAALALACIALVADVVPAGRHEPGMRRAAAGWASAAGLAPVLGALALVVVRMGSTQGGGVLKDLGLSGASPLLVLLGGAVAAAVLLRQAGEFEDVVRSVVGVTALAVAGATAWTSPQVADAARLVGPAAAFLVIEFVALAAARDDFWRAPARALAVAAEVLALPGLAVSAVVVALAPLLDAHGFFHMPSDRSAAGAVALGLLGSGWLVADLRSTVAATAAAAADSTPAARARGRDASTPRSARHELALSLLVGGGTRRAVPAAALAWAGAVTLAVAWTPGIAAGFLVIALLCVVSARPLGAMTAAALCLWAAAVAAGHPAVVPAVGLAGALVLAWASVLHARIGTDDQRALASALALSGALALGIGYGNGPGRSWAVAAVAAYWVLALVTEYATAAISNIARGAMVLVAIDAVRHASPATGAAAAVFTTLVLVADAVRTDDERLAFAAAGTAQLAVGAGAVAAGLAAPAVGLAFAVSAVVWSGLAAVVPVRWRGAVLAAAVLGVATGLLVASADAGAFTDCVIIAGALAVSAGLVRHQQELVHLGAVVMVGGFMGRLAVAGVGAPEAYLAPVAAYLVLAGWQARRRPGVSSWVAYAPSVALLGGAALAERVRGGAGWHALVAGAVGLVAVIAGGSRRLIGPLLLGTALLVAVTIHEALGSLAGVPTWAWLAAGGSALLAAGIAMERTATSPVETGRRVLDLVHERFD